MRPEVFSMKSETRGSMRRLAVTGEIDLSTSARVRACFDRMLGDAQTVEVDLRGVTFMDSSGAHLLAYMRGRAGGGLWVIPSAAVVRLLRLARPLPESGRVVLVRDG